ncbi:MAG: hypothetical protein LBT04_08335 [Prevotellaceae bacterium]|jgi:hypothetical protein|nr:hypothetical protein [Prevotellaceae bacterium]
MYKISNDIRPALLIAMLPRQNLTNVILEDYLILFFEVLRLDYFVYQLLKNHNTL